MIAVEFWGVKARKTGRTLWTADTCRRFRRVAAAAVLDGTVQKENCTVLVSCVKFSTNKSVARQNREPKLREAVPSQHQGVMKSPVD